MLKPHFKIRVVFRGGGMIHLAAWNEPTPNTKPAGPGTYWHAEWINDPAYGDTIGFLDWSAVAAVTWRWSA